MIAEMRIRKIAGENNADSRFFIDEIIHACFEIMRLVLELHGAMLIEQRIPNSTIDAYISSIDSLIVSVIAKQVHFLVAIIQRESAIVFGIGANVPSSIY